MLEIVCWLVCFTFTFRASLLRISSAWEVKPSLNHLVRGLQRTENVGSHQQKLPTSKPSGRYYQNYVRKKFSSYLCPYIKSGVAYNIPTTGPIDNSSQNIFFKNEVAGERGILRLLLDKPNSMRLPLQAQVPAYILMIQHNVRCVNCHIYATSSNW